MKFYLKKINNENVDYRTKIKSISEDSFELTWFNDNPNRDPEQLNQPPSEETDYVDIVTKEKIFADRKTGQSTFDSHQVIACNFSLETKQLVFSNIFKHTYAYKGNTGDFKNLSRMYIPIMYIFVPFSDSKLSECIFVSVTPKTTVDGTEVTEIVDLDVSRTISKCADDLLPNLRLSLEDGVVSAQLIDTSGTEIKKDGVEIYFEATAGYLTKSRSKTDNNGIATTRVVGAEEGKVKAGFKHFSGKTEINI